MSNGVIAQLVKHCTGIAEVMVHGFMGRSWFMGSWGGHGSWVHGEVMVHGFMGRTWSWVHGEVMVMGSNPVGVT